MPGLLAHIAPPGALAELQVGLDKLFHFPTYSSTLEAPRPNLQVARVLRANEEATGGMAQSADGRVRVWLAGHVRRCAAPYGDVVASQVLEAWLNGTFHPHAYDGGFVGCILDLNRQILQVFNDRLGSLPVLYGRNARGFAFAPEAKALFPILGLTPQFAESGLASFLSAGYCLGGDTLFREIHCLEPGTTLTLDLPTLHVSLQRYWKLQFREDPAFAKREDAAAALHAAILRSNDSLLDEAPFDVLLSGGHDSRCMLAAAVRTGHMPRRTFGWGARDDVPYSDPVIARQVAGRFGLPFEFFRYDTGRFVENARDWSYMSELANDNIGWYAEGPGMLEESYDCAMRYTLVGDEAWGWGGEPREVEEGVKAVLAPHIPQWLRSLAVPGAAEKYESLYTSSIQQVLRPAADLGSADRKDFLYLHGRVARFIFSLGYFKELATQVRRPFLTRAVLEVVQALPARLRFHKNLFRSMVRGHYPELRRLPTNMASSLPDWRYDIRCGVALRELFCGLLSERALSDSALSQWIEPAAVARAWRNFIDVPSQPVSRKVSWRALVRYRLVPEALKLRRAQKGDELGGTARRGEFDFFRTLALLMLLEGQFAVLERGRCPRQATESRLPASAPVPAAASSAATPSRAPVS